MQLLFKSGNYSKKCIKCCYRTFRMCMLLKSCLVRLEKMWCVWPQKQFLSVKFSQYLQLGGVAKYHDSKHTVARRVSGNFVPRLLPVLELTPHAHACLS